MSDGAERRRQETAAVGAALARADDAVVRLRADLARARAESENYRVQLLGEREARIDREAEIAQLRAEVPYRPGLPPEPMRRSVALWQARLRTGSQPFMLSFSDEERQFLPRVAAMDADWDRLECRPCRASGTPCPWID